jgi:hypothetical protein
MIIKRIKVKIVLFLIFSLTQFGVSQSKEFTEVFTLIKKSILEETDQILISNVQDLDVDIHGDIWIIDFTEGNLIKYNKTGRTPRIIARKGKGPFELAMPQSLYISEKNKVYVANTIKRVTIFDIKGDPIDSFIPPDVHMPTSCIGVNSDGTILLSGPGRKKEKDSEVIIKNMLHLYTPKGKYIKSFCKPSDNLEKLNLSRYRSAYFTLDNNDNIYVVQPLEYQVSVFDKTGNFKRIFGKKTKYYKEPKFCTEEIEQDEKKWNEFNRNLTYVMDVFIECDKVIVSAKNAIDLKSKQNQYYLDIYSRDSGELIKGGIETNGRLYRVKSGRFYFSRAVDIKPDDEQRIVEVFGIKGKIR